jgi:hypothetical protein
MGLTLKEFSAFTTGADWKTQVMQLGEEITHKIAQVKEFSVFLDYETDGGGVEGLKPDPLNQAEDLPKSINVEKLMADTENEVFMDILRREFDPILSKKTKHHYIIERFGLEARLKLNKQPLANLLP